MTHVTRTTSESRTTSKVAPGDVVRFNVYLPKEAYQSLVKLRDMTGKRSLAETLRSALKFYLAVEEGREAGKEVFLEGQEGVREKIIGP